MVVNDFAGKTIFLDTAPLIYFIEGNSVYQPVLSNLFGQNKNGTFFFIASSITLLEVLVKPLREGQILLANQYKNILTNAAGISIFDITTAIAESAAQLRARYNLKTPDAIQFATCIEMGADYFLTNDIRLKNVVEVNVIMLAEIQ
jgi:predicted nucleic acid-binding protein